VKRNGFTVRVIKHWNQCPEKSWDLRPWRTEQDKALLYQIYLHFEQGVGPRLFCVSMTEQSCYI